MSKYAGTKTEANLRAAFAGESQARNQYTFFANICRSETDRLQTARPVPPRFRQNAVGA